MNKKDTIFKKTRINGDFLFNNDVVSVFDDMLIRSVPGYNIFQNQIIKLSGYFSKENTNIYDLGCSLGTTLFNIQEYIKGKGINYYGYDNSGEMINEANKRLNEKLLNSISFTKKDITKELIVSGASVVVSSLTLQFINKVERLKIIKNVYDGLISDGVFLFVEKIKLDNNELNDLFIKLYYNFKEQNGYSKTEIEQKRIALENVLIPNTLEENINLLKNAGFKENNITIFFKWYNFVGILAIK